MAYYLIEFSIGPNNTYKYPNEVENVEWKSLVYHAKDFKMIGETTKKIKLESKNITSIPKKDVKKLIKNFKSEYHIVDEDDPGIL